MADDDDGMAGFGMALPIPRSLINAMRKDHDEAHMSAEAKEAQVERFISGLDVDGLMALRTILNTGDMSTSQSANFWDGQVFSILRYVKHVDPFTGKDPLQEVVEKGKWTEPETGPGIGEVPGGGPSK